MWTRNSLDFIEILFGTCNLKNKTFIFYLDHFFSFGLQLIPFLFFPLLATVDFYFFEIFSSSIFIQCVESNNVVFTGEFYRVLLGFTGFH